MEIVTNKKQYPLHQYQRRDQTKQNQYTSIEGRNIWLTYPNNISAKNKPKTFPYHFNNDAYTIPYALEGIYKCITLGQKILELTDNWDGNGSEEISEETWSGLISFIITYSKKIYQIDRCIIDIPKIYPSANGSIDIDWETDNYGLLINIAKEGNLATYYADDKAEQKTEGVFNPRKFNINLLPKATN